MIKIHGFDEEYSDRLWADMADISECNFCIHFSCKKIIYTPKTIMVVVLNGRLFQMLMFVPIPTSGSLFSFGLHRSFSMCVGFLRPIA